MARVELRGRPYGRAHRTHVTVDVTRTGTIKTKQFEVWACTGTRGKHCALAYGKNPRAATAAALTKLAGRIRQERSGAFAGYGRSR